MFSNVRFHQFSVIRDKYLTTVTEPFKHLNFFPSILFLPCYLMMLYAWLNSLQNLILVILENFHYFTY